MIAAPVATWANALTALRLIITLPLASMILDAEWSMAALLFAVAVLTDYFDGPLARRLSQASPFGGLVDHGTDALFVTSACTALAWSGFIPIALPLLIPLAFLQYATDSRVIRGHALRANPLGRINGIAYYVLPGIVIGGHALAIGSALADLAVALAWLLTVSTLLSMALRARAYFGEADGPSP